MTSVSEERGDGSGGKTPSMPFVPVAFETGMRTGAAGKYMTGFWTQIKPDMDLKTKGDELNIHKSQVSPGGGKHSTGSLSCSLVHSLMFVSQVAEVWRQTEQLGLTGRVNPGKVSAET